MAWNALLGIFSEELVDDMQNEGVENKKWWIACCKGQRTGKEPPNEKLVCNWQFEQH